MAVAPSDLQSELLFDHGTNQPDVRFAARQMAQIQRELSNRNRHVLRTVGRWLDLYEYVKMLEQDLWSIAEPTRSQTKLCVAMVSMIHGLGTMLLTALQSDDAENLESLGMTFADLTAHVDELAQFNRALNSDMTPARRQEMEVSLFGGA